MDINCVKVSIKPHRQTPNKKLKQTIKDSTNDNYWSFYNTLKQSLTYGMFSVNGFQLGGHTRPNNIRNLSITYAKKNKNYIIKLSVTAVQLKKSIRIMSRYIRNKSTLYFIHSHFGFKLLMNQLHHKTNMLYLTFTKLFKSKLKCKKSKIVNFTFGQLKKLYFITKWKAGLLTNRIDYFKSRLLKTNNMRYPKFGFVNDYFVNYVSVRELNYSNVPFSSMVNLNVSDTSCGFFDIPGNGQSYDTYFLI